MNWHLLTVEKASAELKSNSGGLATQEAEERLKETGHNELVEKKKKPLWLMFLLEFKDFMILILIIAAIIAAVVGDMKDAIVILVIVIINAVIGFIQEYRAEKAMEALKKMAASFAKVKRNNQMTQVPSSDIVPGDVVLLQAGDVVPADLRVIESHGLKIDEASLTGESNAAEKISTELSEEKTPLGDRINMAYKGTMVTYGRGVGLTVATGMQTEIGRIAQMLQEKETLTPLQKRLTEFGKKLSFIVLGICVLLFGVGLLRGEEPVNMMLTSISLAVAAIPEALPAVITIALALGAKRLVTQQALVRKLSAVETLGSVTYICTDKTGTLTLNKMTVKDAWSNPESLPDLPEFKPEEIFLFSVASNQDTRLEADGELKGDPTETALVDYVRNQPAFQMKWLEEEDRIFELPFDSVRKMMTTVHRLNDNKYLVLTKGAFESIEKISAAENIEEIRARADKLVEQGQRVIAYAYKLINYKPSGNAPELEKDLSISGFAGLIDPPRPEVKQAVAECKTAGVVPVMITGDHPVTAKVIAKELGIFDEKSDVTITGPELESLSEEAYEEKIEKIKVYARVSPEQKLTIVKTLQKRNQFVAMTGDGVNDAPALKRANIGVAMGITGTDVSKEAAHMILLDDNFTTIVKAVREGRRIFDNIRKFIKYVMTGNSGEIWAIFLAPVVGLPIPLLPIHILWINLVTDGLPGLALTMEPAEKNIMQRPPRHPTESIFAHNMGWHILLVGLLIGLTSLGTQAWAINTGSTKWQTMVFTVLCFSQLGHVMAIRSGHLSLFQQGLLSNKPLLAAVVFTSLLQIAIIYIPVFQGVFSVEPLTLKELIICLLLSSLTFFAVEVEKFFSRRTLRRSRKLM
jgi:P-type Ca2+ transporter type 2C